MNKLIQARSLYGKTVEIPAEKFRIRVATYAVITYDNKILLVNTKNTGKWFLPGGEVEVGETMQEALLREVKEECGIDIVVGRMLTIGETFFYYDPEDLAFQNFGVYFSAKPQNFALTEKFQVPGDESEKPEWVDINTLRRDDMQFPLDEMFNDLIYKI